MYVIRIMEGKKEYVGCSSPNWLNLLNDTVTKKIYATKFYTKKDAEKFCNELAKDGYDFVGADAYNRFKVVKY